MFSLCLFLNKIFKKYTNKIWMTDQNNPEKKISSLKNNSEKNIWKKISVEICAKKNLFLIVNVFFIGCFDCTRNFISFLRRILLRPFTKPIWKLLFYIYNSILDYFCYTCMCMYTTNRLISNKNLVWSPYLNLNINKIFFINIVTFQVCFWKDILYWRYFCEKNFKIQLL